MQPFYVASQKTKEGVGSWFGAASEGNMANVRTSDISMRVASPESRLGAVSPTSSVNFSYPRGLHGASPPASPTVESIRMTSNQRLASPNRTESVTSRSTTTSDHSLVYDPNSRRMIPKTDLLAREQSVRDASEKPVKKKKQQQGLVRSGSLLAKGTVGRVQGSAIAVDEAAQKRQEQPQAHIQTDISQQKPLHNQPRIMETAQPVVAPRHSQEPPSASARESSPAPTEGSRQLAPVELEPALQESASAPEPEQPIIRDVRKSDGATILPHSEPRQGAPILGRKPSMVQEESEEESEDSVDEAKALHKQDAHRDVADSLGAVSLSVSAPPKQPSLSSESTAVESPVYASSQSQPSPPHQKQYGNVRNTRAHSSSPARSAHFALGTDQLVIRHEPPPRSVSPRKSAMKHSASPSRGASPSDESSEASGPSRFGSETTAVEAPMPRKKSVRVSFDDENTKAVGQSASRLELDSPTPPSSQQPKRHWFNHLGRNRKKDIVSLDDDEVMKPRPALPSFGSVREKKSRDIEERPLVRPLESPSPSGPDSPDRREEHSALIGQSNDHNVGAILNQEQTARNAANISRFREPLPPVVTSVEGGSYDSPSITTSSEDEDEHEIFQDSEPIQEPEPTLPSAYVKEEAFAAHPEVVENVSVPAAAPIRDNQVDQSRAEESVPFISVIQPTPTPKETVGTGVSSLSGSGYFDVPGGFPDEESEDTMSRSRPSPDSVAMDKDQLTQATISTGAVMSSTGSASHTAPLESSESEGDSIYSDAYEDLSDADGDGFMSLDAVVASPISDKASQKLYQKVMTTPPRGTTEDSKAIAGQTTLGSSQITDGQYPEDEWERAKLYWRGLTSDKRKQLEQEAMEEAGAEGDLEEVVQPKKMKRKKSGRKSDPATQEQQSPVNPERTYQIQPGSRAIDEVEEEASSPSNMRKTLRGRQGQETGLGSAKLQKTMRGAPTQSSTAASTGMRKTLRSPSSRAQNSQQAQPADPAGMRKSMRQNGSSQAGLAVQDRASAIAGSRPLSLQGPPSNRDARDPHSKHTYVDNSMSSVEMAKAMQSTLRRRASDSSESSFRRSRPTREGFGFRKSMRANGEPDQSAAGRNSRFSLRSVSPPASPPSPPISMGNRTTIRSTLRSDSSDGSTRRMRLPTFGKSSAKKVITKSANQSRFGDSSDEEDAGPSAFRSRFADSSDEDEGPTPTPAMRNIPKSMRASSSAAAAAMNVPPPRYNEKEEESPDLPDSSDEEATPPTQQKPLSPRMVSSASGRLVKSQSDSHGPQRPSSSRGALVESSTTSAIGTQAMSRPNHQRKGSFLSVLRRKRDYDFGKASHLAADESAPEAFRGAAMAPKSQKQPVADNWPLVEETIDDEKRPMTADNNRAMDAPRPAFMKRRSTNQVLTSGLLEESEGSIQLDGSTKKKKKFGTLRRMFKLDD